jgi:hypothetical protein
MWTGTDSLLGPFVWVMTGWFDLWIFAGPFLFGVWEVAVEFCDL